MTRYQHKKNGTQATLISTDKAAGKVQLVAADGSEIEVTISTFKRWWVKIEEEKEAEVSEKEVMTVDETLASLVSSGKKVFVNDALQELKKAGLEADPSYVEKFLAGQGNEKQKPGSEKKKSRVKREKKESRPANPEMDTIRSFLGGVVAELGGEVFQPPKARSFNALKIGGHMFARVNYNKHRALVCCRSKVVGDSISPDARFNHIFDVGFEFSTLDRREEIKALLVKSCEAQLVVNANREENQQKKKSKKKAGAEKEVA